MIGNYGWQWTETNRTERHLRRFDYDDGNLLHVGKIVGKIMRDGRGWKCFCPSSPVTFIGVRVSEGAARRMVERAIGVTL